MRSKHIPLFFAIFLVLAGAAIRVLSHYHLIPAVPNFAPVAAIAMFGAAYLPRRIAIATPLALMAISDSLIGWYEPVVVASVYFSFAISLMLGLWLRRRVSVGRLFGASVLGSTLFFLITNAAVWQFGHGYQPGPDGLWQAYFYGLPYFRNTVLGDLFYSGLFFGLYQAVMVYLKRRMPAKSASLNG